MNKSQEDCIFVDPVTFDNGEVGEYFEGCENFTFNKDLMAKIEKSIIEDPSKIEKLNKNSPSYSFMYFYYSIVANQIKSTYVDYLDGYRKNEDTISSFDVKFDTQRTINLFKERINVIAEEFREDEKTYYSTFRYNGTVIIEALLDYFFDDYEHVKKFSKNKHKNSSDSYHVFFTLFNLCEEHKVDFKKIEKYLNKGWVLKRIHKYDEMGVRTIKFAKCPDYYQLLFKNGYELVNFQMCILDDWFKYCGEYTGTTNENLDKEASELFYGTLRSMKIEDMDKMVKNINKEFFENLSFSRYSGVPKDKTIWKISRIQENSFKSINNIIKTYINENINIAKAFYLRFRKFLSFRFFVKHKNEFILKPLLSNKEDRKTLIQLIKETENINVIDDDEKYSNYENFIKCPRPLYKIREDICNKIAAEKGEKNPFSKWNISELETKYFDSFCNFYGVF